VRNVAPQLKPVGLAAILLLVGAACSSNGTLDAEALKHEAETVQSDAAEGALLAQDALAGKTTRIYTREHALDLSDAASGTEASLAAATTDPALEPELRQLAELAGQVTGALERLANASGDEERTLADELQAAAEASRKIAEGLA
jgi:small-conductance mechanosensitive channel